VKRLIKISVIFIIVMSIIVAFAISCLAISKSIQNISDKNEDEELVEEQKILYTSPSGYSVKLCYSNSYIGEIVKIEDNKIFFMVDKIKEAGNIFIKDVEDYQVIFDIDTYNLDYDPLDTQKRNISLMTAYCLG